MATKVKTTGRRRTFKTRGLRLNPQPVDHKRVKFQKPHRRNVTDDMVTAAVDAAKSFGPVLTARLVRSGDVMVTFKTTHPAHRADERRKQHIEQVERLMVQAMAQVADAMAEEDLLNTEQIETQQTPYNNKPRTIPTPVPAT